MALGPPLPPAFGSEHPDTSRKPFSFLFFAVSCQEGEPGSCLLLQAARSRLCWGWFLLCSPEIVSLQRQPPRSLHAHSAVALQVSPGQWRKALKGGGRKWEAGGCHISAGRSMLKWWCCDRGPGFRAIREQAGQALTTMRLRDTQQSSGKSCSIGTRNWRQPSQWHSSNIIPIRFTIRTTALARS